MQCVIIDCGSGNLHSAAKALERAAYETGYPGQVLVTDKAEVARRATHLVLPGVGAFSVCRAGLFGLAGMVEVLEERVQLQGYPFLGICVGMQVMAEFGTEGGRTAGLGWIAGEVGRLLPTEAPEKNPTSTLKPPSLKVPQMGWNDITPAAGGHPLFEGLPAGSDFYFVHSYHLVASKEAQVLARTDYGGSVVAAVAQASAAGVQFHPEKSHRAGLQLLGNFLQWNP